MKSVHIWLAYFSSQKAFESYFAEQYEKDDLPLNQFAADRGVNFYDRDWVESSFQNSVNLKQLIASHSYAEIYMTKVLEAAAKLDINHGNTFILADVNEFKTPVSKQTKDYCLNYIGQFSCIF